jgi:NitT/TauT family transport system substrate-binding protein
MAPRRPKISDRPTRRTLLAGTGATLAVTLSGALAHRVAAAEIPVFKVGTLPFGTAHWLIETIVSNGFDKDAGLTFENVPLASNEAARVAFLSSSVDTIVNDLLFAARLKSEGKPIQFLPYSSTEGALMTPAASSIKGLADLKGKTIGIAGGPLDKGWLLFRAAAQGLAGFDLAKDARPVFGAPPLLAAKVESGELDCGLLYWSACARLAAKGYKQVLSVEQVSTQLGAKGEIAFGGFLVHDDAKEPVLAAFSKAIRRGVAHLADTPAAWTSIRPLMQAPDEATFQALKEAFIHGIPHKSRADEIADAQSFFAIVAKLGGTALVGNATSLPEDLYVDKAVYG